MSSLAASSSDHSAAALDTKPKARSKRDRRRAPSASVSSSGSSQSSAVSTSTSAAAAEDLSNPVRDLVARIYEEELRKLMSVAEQKGNAVDARTYDCEIKRLLFLRTIGDGPKRSPPHASDGAGVAAEDSENVNGVDVDDAPQDLSTGRQRGASSEESSSLVTEAAAETGTEMIDSRVAGSAVVDGLSPLQRMQCIANSLPATTATQSTATAVPSRQLLAPISAEQMAACEEKNTDDVVAKVRHDSTVA